MSQTPPYSSDSPPRMTLCVGAVVRCGNAVLFVRQTYGEGLTGVWTLPWGFVQGALPDGAPDPPHLAALRETLEEGGVRASVDGLLGVQNHASRSGEPRVYLLFLCQHVAGEPAPDGAETDRAAYFSLTDLEALDEPVDAFCLWLARRVLRGDYHLIPLEAANPYTPHEAFF
ncbi:MAG: NUDIX domain-containing protein [Anaerolineae bacterium]|nr:NUDIX domain-containing protein [Anaerolineae bacterium]